MQHVAESCSPYSVVPRANADIAHVRVKAKQEQVAYQASLRKEQMKVDSLERTLEQKVSSAPWRPRPVVSRSVQSYLHLCRRTRRSRSWLRSVTSSLLKWGRVSDRTSPGPDLRVRKKSGSDLLDQKTDGRQRSHWSELLFLLTLCTEEPQEWSPDGFVYFLMCQPVYSA